MFIDVCRTAVSYQPSVKASSVTRFAKIILTKGWKEEFLHDYFTCGGYG